MVARAIASASFWASEYPAMRFIQARSAPAEKLLPLPARSTTRTAGSLASASSPSVTSAIKRSSKALWRSGRFSHRVAIPSAVSIRIWLMSLHPEHAEARLFKGGIERGKEAQTEHAATVRRRDDSVVPKPRAGVIRMPLLFILSADRCLEGFFLHRRPGLLHIVLLDLGQHGRRLLATHHRDAGIGPHPEEAWTIGAPAHAVIARAETAADDEGELGYLRAGDRGHHLGTVLGDAAGLVFSPHHESRDVLQEDQRNAALGAKLDEMRALQG